MVWIAEFPYNYGHRIVHDMMNGQHRLLYGHRIVLVSTFSAGAYIARNNIMLSNCANELKVTRH